MHIILYKSKTCPRCFIAGKHLHSICATNPNLQVEEVEILTSPLRTWKDGIRMIPALKVGDSVLSSLYLSREAIANFLDQMSDKGQ